MIIYKASFPNRKCYIGKTIKTLNERKHGHKYSSLKVKSKFLFHKAIRKYGWDDIVWSIVENNINDVNLLNDRETYWIKKLNTISPHGYNICLGGEGQDNFTNNPNKEKIRERMKKAYTPELRKIRSENAKRQHKKGILNCKGKNNPSCFMSKEKRLERGRKTGNTLKRLYKNGILKASNQYTKKRK
jgi:hypothetical protein